MLWTGSTADIANHIPKSICAAQRYLERERKGLHSLSKTVTIQSQQNTKGKEDDYFHSKLVPNAKASHASCAITEPNDAPVAYAYLTSSFPKIYLRGNECTMIAHLLDTSRVVGMLLNNKKEQQ